MLTGRPAEGVRSVVTGHSSMRNWPAIWLLGTWQQGRRARGEGERLLVAPRVLVDATAVPADRGALGRYVDGLVAALGATGADLAVACQRNDEERYGRLVPEATVVAGPTAIAHRPARLAWEQTGLPLVAQQVNADVLHAPHYTMPLRPGVPVVLDHPRPDVLHRAGRAQPGQRDLLQVRDPHRGPAGHPAARAVQGHPGRAGARARRRPDPDRRGLPRRGPRAVPPAQPRSRMRQVSDRLGLHGKPYVAYLGGLEPRKNVPALISGWAGAVADLADPPALVLGGRQRLERGGGRGRRRGPGAPAPGPPRLPALQRPARLPRRRARGRLPEPRRGFRAARAGGHGLRRAGADHAPDVAARRSAGTRSPTPSRTPRTSRRRCAACSMTRPGWNPSARPGTPGPRSSPGRPRPRLTWRPTSVQRRRAQSNLAAHVSPARNALSAFPGRPRAAGGDPARRRPGDPAAPAHHRHAQAAAADRGRAVPGPPVRQGGGGRDHPRGAGHRLPGQHVHRVLRGRRRVRAGDLLRARGGAARHRRGDPERRVRPAQRPGQPGRRAERRRPVRPRHLRADRPAPQG